MKKIKETKRTNIDRAIAASAVFCLFLILLLATIGEEVNAFTRFVSNFIPSIKNLARHEGPIQQQAANYFSAAIVAFPFIAFFVAWNDDPFQRVEFGAKQNGTSVTKMIAFNFLFAIPVVVLVLYVALFHPIRLEAEALTTGQKLFSSMIDSYSGLATLGVLLSLCYFLSLAFVLINLKLIFCFLFNPVQEK